MMNEWIISSSVLITAVLLGRFLLRGRISLRLQYALWTLVLVRLLLPLQLFTSGFGTGSIAKDVDMAEPVRQVYVSANEDRYEREYDAAYKRIVAQHEASGRHMDPIVIEKEAAALAKNMLELDLTQTLYHVWFAGMAGMASVIIFCNIHLSTRLKRRREALEVPDSLLPVYVTDVVPTPCIFGFFKPAVYLTPDAVKDPQVRNHVLTHELTHYRHWDHVWSVLRSVCLVLHWYNPLVWIAAKVSRADAELACDEGALARLGEEFRGDYGRTLIGLTCSAPIRDLLLTATTMTGSAGSIRERIKLLMQRPRNTVLTVTAVIVMVTLIVGCTFSGAPETTEQTETKAPGVDNDMSYESQDLPIPEDPAGIFHDEGILVYPGVEWFMTEEEVLAALGVSREDCWEWEYTNAEGMEASSFTVNHADAFGVPIELCFTFRSFWDDVEPVLTEVYGHFENQADFKTVRTLYTKALGETDYKNTPGVEETWYSKATFRELFALEGNEILRDRVTTDADIMEFPASSVIWVDNGSCSIIWHTELPLPDVTEGETKPVAEVGTIDYFTELLNPQMYRSEADWYPRALTSFYDDPSRIDLYQLFYGGIPGVENIPSDEELEVLKTWPGYFPELSLKRISAAEMDQVLREYFGIALEDTEGIGLENFLYWKEGDCYYHSHSDTNLSFREITAIQELEGDLWRVSYTSQMGNRCTTTLRQAETGWQIVSNQFVS